MKLLLHWLFSALALMIAAHFVAGTHVTLVGALFAAVVLGALNLLLRPILMVLTLPITILTLGLFSFVINAGLILLASHLVRGFEINGFIAALWFSVALTLINWVFHFFSRHD